MYRDHQVLLGSRRRSEMLQGGRRVRFTKLAVVLLAMMLVGAGCGARLSKAQLAKAANSGGGQRLSVGVVGDEGTDTGPGGEQAAGGGSTAAGGGAAGRG